MRNILNHIKFLLRATNQHGVHSPFIYTYVTQCLYAEQTYGQKKSENILLKSIAYFKAERVWLPPTKNSLKKKIQSEFASIQFENGPYDILFTNPAEAKKLIFRTDTDKKIHDNALLLIDGIYANAMSTSIWEKIKNDHKVSVSVDMFYCGAVFFRKEQAKEHFKIRI